MKALYLRPRVKDPALGFSNITNGLPTPADLVYSDGFPRPQLSEQGVERNSKRSYLLKVLTTSPTRGELVWPEQLETAPSKRARFGPVPCHDVVGEVIAISGGAESASESRDEGLVGPQVQVGDKVFGLVSFDLDGAAVEEAVALEREIAKVPQQPDGQGVDGEKLWEEMLATIPLAGFTAWQALFDKGGLEEPRLSDDESTDAAQGNQSTPKQILISGASGAVGLLALQLLQAAKSPINPLHITAICSPRPIDAVRSLGPDLVVTGEQMKEGIESQGPFDLFLELTGGPLRDGILSMHKRSQGGSGISTQLMKPTGKIVSITSPLMESELESEIRDLEDRIIYFIFIPEAEQLMKIGKLVQMGILRGFVHDEVFPLEKGKQAPEECERRGRKGLGKVVLRVHP